MKCEYCGYDDRGTGDSAHHCYERQMPGMKSDWVIVSVTEDKVLIKDLNLGRMSVTNDAENVYAHLQKQYPDKRVIYCDSDDNWDEIYIGETWMGKGIAFKPYRGEV